MFQCRCIALAVVPVVHVANSFAVALILLFVTHVFFAEVIISALKGSLLRAIGLYFTVSPYKAWLLQYQLDIGKLATLSVIGMLLQ